MPPTIQSQSITFENNRAATAVFPPANTKAADILTALNIEGQKAVLLVIGGADNVDASLKSKLTQLYGRGIARAAANVNAVIIDGGTKSGVMEMMGQGVADRGFQSSLIGVSPVGKINYPGSTGAGETPLDPNHSHFVLVPGDAWGSETSTIFQLVGELRNKVPVVALLAAGGSGTRNEALQAVRQNLPLIIVEGSGGLADEIAAAWKARHTVPDDPLMAEIVADGRIELHLLGDPVKAAERLIVRELGGDNVLLQAWERFSVYDFNAGRQQFWFDFLQGAVMVLGVLATALAIGREVARGRGANVDTSWTTWWYIKQILLALPILLTILITAANKFKQGNKWLLLRAGAESIKREIYRYRSRAGDYKEILTAPPATPTGTPALPPPTPEQVLAQKIEDITRRAMRTELNSSALKPYDKEKDFPPYVKHTGDDGFSVLSPDRYVQVRLEDQLGFYKRGSVREERSLQRIQWAIYIIGGLGTLLAAINQQVWIALTTAGAAALTTYLSYRQTESTLTKYNQAFTDLDNVKAWWTALPAAEQAKQENVDTLVDHTEQVLQSELDGWVQQMQNALAELRKGQEKAPETADGSSSSPAAPGEIATVTTKTGGVAGGDDDDDTTAPADDATVPADDATAPADDATAPADDATVPADDATATADDATVPADDATATADDATVPADDATAPADDATALADDATVPADDATVPADDATVPADDGGDSTGNETSGDRLASN
jgi:hypothetical protein